MDSIQTFIFMVLSYLTNVISGASLGNIDIFNETFDAEDQHRKILQNIQRNYADEFRNYEMADIENYLSGFMPPVKKEKIPIFTSKTFFGSDQFFGAREKSKGSSHPETWDPFRANRVIGSQPSYFDVPDDLFQQYIYNYESKTGDDNDSEFRSGLSENKDKFSFSDRGNKSSHSKDVASHNLNKINTVEDKADEVDELSRPVYYDGIDYENDLSHPIDDDSENKVDELSHSVDDDAEDQGNEHFRPVDDTEDEVDDISRTINDDTEGEMDQLLHPVDNDVLEELLHPVDDIEDEQSNPVVDDAEHQENELSHPVDDTEDENEHSHHAKDIEGNGNELSRPEAELSVDDAENQKNEHSRPINDDTEDEVDELSHPINDDAEDEVDELSHPINDDAEDEVDELSHPINDDTEDEVDDVSDPVDEEKQESKHFHQVGQDGEDIDQLSHPLDDTENRKDESSRNIDDVWGKVDELSHTINAEDELDEFPNPSEAVNQEDISLPKNGDKELSEPVRENIDDEESELFHRRDDEIPEDEHSHLVGDDGKDQVDEFSETIDDGRDRVDELGWRSRPFVELLDQANEIAHPTKEKKGEVDKFFHPEDKTQSVVQEISHPIDGTEARIDDLSAFEEGLFVSKDFSMNQVATDKVFSGLPHSNTPKLDEFVDHNDSVNHQEGADFQSLDNGEFEGRIDEHISDGDNISSEFFLVDKQSPTKVTEDLRQLSVANSKGPFDNPGNDASNMALNKQNENESFFGEISDEHLEKVQSVSDSDLIEFVKINFHNSTEDPDFSKADIDEFQGSGDVADSFSSLESKSGRIIDVFPRVNSTAECTTPKGERGRCLSLTQCPLSEPLNNFNSFLQYVCLSRGVLIGICCPDNPVVEISDPTENSTGTSVTELKQPDDGCGLNTNTRIVGGKVSFPHEWTWMVALLRRNRFFCGGVIINDWYILTAAHCVMGVKLKDLKVRLGEYNFNEKNEHQEDIPVAEIKRHALFVTLTFQHDIALLKLKRRIEYSKFIGSICLPNPKSGNFSNVNATVVGWGTVAFGGSASPVLRQVTVPVWDNDECDKTYRLERITDAFMCAGSPENGEDACQGDSGGPLMALSEAGRWEVIGIVSWGRRCGDPTFPGVYTRVTSYLDWIAENAN